MVVALLSNEKGQPIFKEFNVRLLSVINIQ